MSPEEADNVAGIIYYINFWSYDGVLVQSYVS